ncbi:MAG: hypothetical protein Q7S27_03110 [Nanoarchaeota archaeon]|nr:hypothetical protein [Nanoarchaeota archaeon]
MQKLLKTPHLYSIIAIFFIYSTLNFYTSGFNNTFQLILKYASTVNWLEIIISITFSLIIGIFVALNSVLLYIKYKERQKCKNQTVLAGLGAIGGLATGFCPLCVTGLLPLILGLLGITFSFASLPFNGLEIQLLVIIILFSSYKMIKK